MYKLVPVGKRLGPLLLGFDDFASLLERATAMDALHDLPVKIS